MKNDKILDAYFDIICESKKKKAKRLEFKPFIYKNVKVEMSLENNDSEEHFNDRLNDRKIYSVNEITTIIKRSIDHYLTDKAYERYKLDKQHFTEFTIISKQYPSIKIKLRFKHNNERTLDLLNGIETSPEYICTLKTILYSFMKDRDKDVKLVVETNQEAFPNTVLMIVE